MRQIWNLGQLDTTSSLQSSIPKHCSWNPRYQEMGMEIPRKTCLRRTWEALVCFPRVFAEESTIATASRPSPEETLPHHIKGPVYPETGWERLKELLVRDEHQPVPQEIDYIFKAATTGAIVGWIYGGIPAFYHAKQRYISQSHAEIYYSRFDAVQSAQRAAIRGFIRYGWRWSWRTALFVTIFKVPFGVMIMAIEKYQGETVWDRKQKARKDLYELKLDEWKARLHVTDAVTEEFKSNLGKNQTEKDVKRIEELLNLPRNPSSTTDSEDE
ncbi:complex I assembly factor TIMMDC1, mitochondrial isoform X2 [Monodelphis domestica]|uniref:complex I assembly factor TIMMDC1, mitochondrial isoform X2 n=1 Tax=Monodelphis domestica TaxID=13616 RepID=UPI0024E1B0B0|nr:complex I assembly factor TIMMDC1, mitochondrial isoform X2 [Monodelphis domestica]